MISITVNISEYDKYYDLALFINSVLNIIVLCANVTAFYEIDNIVYQENNNIMMKELYNYTGHSLYFGANVFVTWGKINLSRRYPGVFLHERRQNVDLGLIGVLVLPSCNFSAVRW